MVPSSAFGKRLKKLQERLAAGGMEGVVIAPGPNMLYYTGVRSKMLERPFLMFVPSDGSAHMVAPNLEAGPYAKAPVEIEMHDWTDTEGPKGAFGSLRRSMKLNGRWGCEGSVPFGYLTQIQDRKLALEPADPVLQSIREIKEEAELSMLREAAKILAAAYLKVPEIAKAGLTEMEVARLLREEIFALGGETVDFCDVQAGKNAADPHWGPSSAKLRTGEGYLIDSGCTVGGYNADITRTFVLGRNVEVEAAYADVLEAQLAGLQAARKGATTGEVDSATRGKLETKGRGDQFFHRTGHGLGLEIHEEPYVGSGGRELLKPGMVFTVEPGVYVEGRYGVRIEDDVAVTSRGAEVITGSLPKEFGWWK